MRLTPLGSNALPLVILLGGVALIFLDRTALLSPPAYTERGAAAFERGEWVESIRLFSQAQKHCETDILAHRMLGMSYHNYQWNDEALRQYESVWGLFAQEAALAMRNAGRLYRERGENDQALMCYQRALGTDPAFVGAWVDLADLHIARNEWQPALEAIGRAIELEPENASLKSLRERIMQRLTSEAPKAPEPTPSTPTPRPGGGQ